MRIFFLNGIACLLSVSCLFSQSAGEMKDDADVLHRAEKALTDIIVHDIFSPPVASRIYVYANIAAYEILVKADDSCRSLHGIVRSFPKIVSPEKKISFPLAAVYAFFLTGKKLVFSEAALQDSINNILQLYQNGRFPASVYQSSLEYGQKVSDMIIAWLLKDQYSESRN